MKADRKAYIYMITNPKGNIYIGSTVNIKDRMYRYKTNRVVAQIKVHRSIAKYGWDSHKFKIIHECAASEKLHYESHFGLMYDALGENGLNLSLPKLNDKYCGLSEETKLRIGKAHKGKKISEKQKLQIGKRSKAWHQNNEHPMTGAIPWNTGKEFLKGEKNPMFGVRRSEEWCKEHRKRAKIVNPRASKHPKSKIVLDLSTGVFYDCVRQAKDYATHFSYPYLKQMLNGRKPNVTTLIYA